jgi:hypothetical protein
LVLSVSEERPLVFVMKPTMQTRELFFHAVQELGVPSWLRSVEQARRIEVATDDHGTCNLSLSETVEHHVLNPDMPSLMLQPDGRHIEMGVQSVVDWVCGIVQRDDECPRTVWQSNGSRDAPASKSRGSTLLRGLCPEAAKPVLKALNWLTLKREPLDLIRIGGHAS